MGTKDTRSKGKYIKTFKETIKEDMKYLKRTEDLAQTVHNDVLGLPTLLNGIKLDYCYNLHNVPYSTR